MILLDTNVLIYAFDLDSPFYAWARETIASAVAGEGVAINAVSLAELCVGDAKPSTVADRIRSWGVEILDVSAAAADMCATAYRQYQTRRMSQSEFFHWCSRQDHGLGTCHRGPRPVPDLLPFRRSQDAAMTCGTVMCNTAFSNYPPEVGAADVSYLKPVKRTRKKNE
jgi:predicted nucleic acid-binding protein